MARCCGARPKLPSTDSGVLGPQGPEQHGLSLQEYVDTLPESWQVAPAMSFPMYVVKVTDLLQMSEVRPHADLKRAGLVREYEPCLGVAAFVSHQWCSRRHPDPMGGQLRILQSALRHLAAGSLHLQVSLLSFLLSGTRCTVNMADLRQVSTGFVWYDYFSVPQPGAQASQHLDMREDVERAVFSIPAYVEASQFFVILAPPLAHADFPELMVDYRSWKERGWCRLERISRILSPTHTHILLLPQEQNLFQVGVEDYLFDPVGDGAFGVEGDRARLAPVMVALVEKKLQALLGQRDLHTYRWLLSARATILRGLPGVSPHDVCAPGFRVAESGSPLDSFLRLYGLQSGEDHAGGRTAPILLAARGGNTEVVEELLRGRADVHTRERANDPASYRVPGATPLHVASLFGSVPVVSLLLQHRADVEVKNSRGYVPLMSAASSGHLAAVDALLAHRASVATGESHGIKALQVAAGFGRAEVVVRLLQARAPAAPSQEGMSPLFLAGLMNAGRRTVEALLAAPDVGLDVPFCSRWFSPTALFAAACSVPRRLWGSRRTFAVLACEVQGMTPLMAAGLFGSIGEARALIAAGASTTARNSKGRTAAELAELAGWAPNAVAFLLDPETKAAWELRHLHETVAKLTARLVALEAAAEVEEVPRNSFGQRVEEVACGVIVELIN